MIEYINGKPYAIDYIYVSACQAYVKRISIYKPNNQSQDNNNALKTSLNAF